MLTVPDFSGKTVAVFGLGKAGLASVALLHNSGARVLAWDDNDASRAVLLKQPYASDVLIAPPESYQWYDIAALVLSPGIPFTHPEPHKIVKLATAARCPIICDVDLLYRACPHARFVGITGTNGKSTTTALIGHLFKTAGIPTEVGGNIGVAASDLKELDAKGTYVIELSSYQLDLMERFHANMAVFLNLTPDHLDRHGDMEGYLKAKMHIFDRQSRRDVAIIAVDDAFTQFAYKRLEKLGRQQLVAVSATRELDKGVYVLNGEVHIRLPVKRADFGLGHLIHLRGQHNWQNIAAAVATLVMAGVPVAVIEKGIKSFIGLPHRIQQVADKNGVLFINDSKATNAEAAEKAISAFDSVLLIAGGKPKAGGIKMLEPLFKRLKHVYLIGDAAQEFAATLQGKVPFTHCGTLDKAVAAAAKEAFATQGKKPVVLLSPACASFDQFKSYEDRGEQFIQLVKAL